MDSIRNSEFFSRQGAELIHIAEQDTTDFDKSLRVFNRCKCFLALGFLGKRSDHYLGAFSTILRNPNLKVILVNKYDVIFLMPRRFRIMLPKKTRLSLFPFGEVQGVKSKGLKYPIDGINFTPFGMTGISNETVDEQVEIEVKTKKMLLILPRKYLKKVISQIN
jgi:thiamine pyrophosphokinase